MGNIITPDQGLLPLPAYGSLAGSPYPWWLAAALAIWALLALLCCWLLLLLYLLRYCCKWCRHRQYAANRKSLRERFFGGAGGAGGAKGQRNMYATRDQHFATAPLPLVPPYAVSGENEFIRDEFYGDVRPYATAARNGAYESGSESYSEREIRNDGVILPATGLHPITVASERSLGGGGGAENIETNIHRNITKNYYINEEQNYFIQQDPAVVETTTHLHDQEIQNLPPPTVTTINMAAERITDNQNWENANTKEDFDNQKPKQISADILPTDPLLLQQDVKYEKQPNIYTHRPITPEIPRVETRPLPAVPLVSSDHGSTTSEMSGHDSESIYETIRVFTPKKQVLQPLEDEDEYKTAGVDEVEFEIKDLVRLQRASGKSGGGSYDDILTSTAMTRQRLTPRLSSSISSSSTLNNLMPMNSQQEQANVISGGAEQKEETVTETIQTQQVQTTFRQIGQHLDDSAFFIPLPSSDNHYETQQQSDDRKIIIPVSTSTIHYEERPALQHL